MEYKVFTILSSPGRKKDWFVSFKKFAEFIAGKVKDCDGMKSKFYSIASSHLKRNKELLQPIHIDELQNHQPLLNLLEAVIIPHLDDERQTATALAVPFTDTFFFTTAAFYRLALKHKASKDIQLLNDREHLFKVTRMKHKYALILERLYNARSYLPAETVHVWRNNKDSIIRYFSMQIDNRFVDVETTMELPELDADGLMQQLENNQEMTQLEELLPMKNFSFSGFSMITATDITPRYALHKMRSAIIKHSTENYDDTYKNILSLLKSLCGVEEAEFGLLPFLKLNDKLVSYYKNYAHSIMINISKQLNFSEEEFTAWLNNYYKQPHALVKKQCSNDGSKGDELYNAFTQLGFKAYSLLPVYYNDEVAGLLEVSVKDAELMNSNLLLRVDSAMPILGQLMHHNQAEFISNINKVISMNFTSIQPSVLWKFNEVAWDYIKTMNEQTMRKLEEIRFSNVNPLYGAVDIRNSTIERNNALLKDMRIYFSMVKNMFNQLQVDDDSYINELKQSGDEILQHAEDMLTGNEDTAIDIFMYKVYEYLKEVDREKGHNKNIINNYLKDINNKNGRAYTNRRILENSMQYLNFVISDYLNKMQLELQQQYPIYFEKFRTDGIEYDIYLGQSVSPALEYKSSFLSELRFLQLKNMANITRLVYTSAESLPFALQTTQLIYANASAIDITFRMDEKRFDVEGGYNIRYHIVKKRIDKVHIKQSGERLTQPGKIAIVFTDQNMEAEYLHYINELCNESLLVNDAEVVELEELQGVTGLRAIRVSVVLD